MELGMITFEKSLTHEGTFNTGTENITISMMLTKRFVPYIFDRKNVVELISLPYKNGHYSMWNRKSLQDVEKNLHLNELKSLINKMEYKELEIKIPRMKLELEINLTEDLKALGISQIFDSGADFGRLTSKAGMFVSDIIHKAVLEVTEEGTTAAAVASGKIQEKSLPGEFYLDEPSLIFIRDNKIGSLLFWTRVMKA
ncbi:Serpin B11 [Armadillidium nasatum]|uniref:Serpin B11 n=1 Tax=Armadillidium nasatum TaxID=96803 RepID=A0A5N5TEM5_9CRUS|nr:Serpin B11 [Armadillidium nasatum]